MAAIILAVLVSLGTVCGQALGRIAKEELKDGKRYLQPLQIILFMAATLFVMWIFRFNAYTIAAGTVAIFLFLYFFKQAKNWCVYAYLGAVHAIALTTQYYLPIASLLFLYGFPTGSYVKDKKELLYCILAFVIVSVLTAQLLG